LINGPHSRVLLHTTMESVACSLTDMMGNIIINGTPKVKRLPIAKVTVSTGSPETKVVGVYLEMESGLRGRVILILPTGFALNLVDMVMEAPRGTANSLGLLERSVLAEVGNLTLAYFLNAIADLTDESEMLQPSPPTVVVDMLGAILNIVVAPAAVVRDDLLIIETVFIDIAKSIQFRFWVLPDPKINLRNGRGET